VQNLNGREMVGALLIDTATDLPVLHLGFETTPFRNQ
jgi:hypothetical protein